MLASFRVSKNHRVYWMEKKVFGKTRLCYELNKTKVKFYPPRARISGLFSVLFVWENFGHHKHFIKQKCFRNCCINTALSPVWQQTLSFPWGSWAARGEIGGNEWVCSIFLAKINHLCHFLALFSHCCPSLWVFSCHCSADVPHYVSFSIPDCIWLRSSSMTHKATQVGTHKNE